MRGADKAFRAQNEFDNILSSSNIPGAINAAIRGITGLRPEVLGTPFIATGF